MYNYSTVIPIVSLLLKKMSIFCFIFPCSSHTKLQKIIFLCPLKEKYNRKWVIALISIIFQSDMLSIWGSSCCYHILEHFFMLSYLLKIKIIRSIPCCAFINAFFFIKRYHDGILLIIVVRCSVYWSNGKFFYRKPKYFYKYQTQQYTNWKQIAESTMFRSF